MSAPGTSAVCLLALMSLSISTTSRADIEIALGATDEIDGVSTEAASISYLTEQRHPWEFMLGHIRDRDDVRLSTPTVTVVAVSRRLTWRNWMVLGGVAWTDSDTEVLSENWQFMTGVGYQWNQWALTLRHLSNANTGGRNRGENLLMLQYRF